MSPEALAYLERPALRRLLFAARERFERNAGPFGKLSLAALTLEEAHALNGLLEPPSPYLPGREATVKLPRLDAKLRDSRLGVSLQEALVAVDGPLADARAERAAAPAAREVAWARVLAHPVAAPGELAPWLDHPRHRWKGASRERTAIV
ncbi:MAG: TIGR02679 domain-containing protein, partial [Solirubrobacteraceae bacterium]